jgi:predicted glycosyltransferase
VGENSTNINKINIQKRALVVPLDWGLGHATRCVPIITVLLAQGFEVFIGAEGAGAALLKKEFPLLKILPFQGYRIFYSKNKMYFLWKVMAQFPKIMKAIFIENRWLKKIINEHKIDIVISDNRFGLYNKDVRCIFITHQLQIKTGNSFTEKIVQKVNYTYINKFDECWVIDEKGNRNLAGDLSHPIELPNTKVKYIGALSRLKKYEVEKQYDLLAILSGPEPQRTIFENILLTQMQFLKLDMVLVRGLPAEENILEIEDLKIYNHLPATVLNELILASKKIIARSGYTTVMDIAALQQKAIFVPTPGQTEQEYLAKYLSMKKYCIAEKQDGFNLQNALDKLENTALVPYPTIENDLLLEAIIALR